MTAAPDQLPLERPAPDRAGPQTLPSPPGWPERPPDAVYQGLAGEIVHRIAPHTEADPLALLAQLLVGAGAIIGRGAHFQVEATRHHPNEFLLLIGDSAKARKGSSWDHVARVLERAQPGFGALLRSGLSSGEGLVWSVRDPEGPDGGTSDGRLLVVEPEFASVLKASAREISTLSPVLRSAWDGRPLALLTRTAPARASAAHVAVIGHITAHELRHHTHAVELHNGFLNRFVQIACRRVRLLPEGGSPDPLARSGLESRLGKSLTGARRAGPLRLSGQARALWHEAYIELSAAPTDGPAAALAARAEAHVIRLALIYALIDGARQVAPRHLHAALALWDYAEQSAAWALGQAGDPLAEQIHAALTGSHGGLTRTQLRDLLQRNQPTRRIESALATLKRSGRAQCQRVQTDGRPAELWTATDPPAQTDSPASPPGCAPAQP